MELQSASREQTPLAIRYSLLAPSIDRKTPAQSHGFGLDLRLDLAIAGFTVPGETIEHLDDHAADVAEL